MAITAKLFEEFPVQMGGSTSSGGSAMDMLSDAFKYMLTTSTYTPSQANHTIKSDVTNEVSGTGYTAGGVTLTTKTYAAASLVSTWDADDVSWTTSTITARNGVIYDDTTATPVKPLVLYHDYGGDQSTSGTTFQVTMNASGLYTITVS